MLQANIILTRGARGASPAQMANIRTNRLLSAVAERPLPIRLVTPPAIPRYTQLLSPLATQPPSPLATPPPSQRETNGVNYHQARCAALLPEAHACHRQ